MLTLPTIFVVDMKYGQSANQAMASSEFEVSPGTQQRLAPHSLAVMAVIIHHPSPFRPFPLTQAQWRREGVCRPGQTSVLPPSPIRSVLQSVFVRISDMGV